MDPFEEVKLRIKDGVELVALVEEYVPLKTRGRYHIGLCPFHQEKTPSFTVYSDTQHYKCYGCGKAGDVFSFLMERDGLSFRDAMEVLAGRLGISTEGVFKSNSGGRRRADVHGALGEVATWFQEQLHTEAGAAARHYLDERGLSAAIEGFGLGFHPAGGRLRQFVQKRNLPRNVMEQAGLIGADGYERFHGRLMFPIQDERGRTMGFGGRVLQSDAERAKYLNSPESPFFNKRKLLFGLKQAKKAGVRQLVVMEGYTDVIAAHLAGFDGAVATLGTALTTDHARLLERYATEGVVLLFDGDRAGRQAADRAFRELVHTRLPVRVALLDEGTDPADLVSDAPGRDADAVTSGRSQLRSILETADDVLTVWFRLLRQEQDLTLDVNVERVTGDCARILKSVENPVRRQALGQRMAGHLGLQESVFLRTVSKALARKPPARKSPTADDAPAREAHADSDEDPVWSQATPKTAGPNGTAAEPEPRTTEPTSKPVAEADLDLLACLLAEPALLGTLPGAPETDEAAVSLPEAREILGMFRAGVAKGLGSKDEIVGYLFMRCAERPDLSEQLAGCVDRSAHVKSPPDTLSRLLKDRSAHESRHHAQNIRYRLQQARAQGDDALANELTEQYLHQLRSRGATEG